MFFVYTSLKFLLYFNHNNTTQKVKNMAKSTKFTKSYLNAFAAKYPGAFKKDLFETTPVSGNQWHLFSDATYNCPVEVWLPTDIAESSMSIANKIKKLEAAFASEKDKNKYNLYVAPRSCGGTDVTWDWFDVTEGRLQLLGKLVELTQAAAKLHDGKSDELIKAEAELEKAKKKVADLKKKSDEIIKISANTRVKQDVAFIKTEKSEGDAFKYVFDSGSVDMCWSKRESCYSANAIDHVINMLKKRASQTSDMLAELEKAKKAGAKFVIDNDYEALEDFKF